MSGGEPSGGEPSRGGPDEAREADLDLESPIDRRRFVARCMELGAGAAAASTAAAAGVSLAACASLAAVRVTPDGDTLRLAVRNHPRLDRPGGQLEVVADGVPRPILVVAQDNGSYLALSSECTHLKCTVELEGGRIRCPCHGSTFDRGGQVLAGPAERPLNRYPTRLREDGVLEISL